MDQIILLVNGRIAEMGKYDELIELNGEFSNFLKSHVVPEMPPESEEEYENNDGTDCYNLMTYFFKKNFCYNFRDFGFSEANIEENAPAPEEETKENDSESETANLIIPAS